MSGRTFGTTTTINTHGTHGTTTTLETPLSSAHVILPESAMSVVKAGDQNGGKVAIAGFSVSNFGVFASSETDVGLFATGLVLAAKFEGHVDISGNLHTAGNHTVDGDILMSGADYAEDFDVGDSNGVEPGSVVILDDTGGVQVSDKAYDSRVAGVISGAGGYKPAIVLDHRISGRDRRPIALMGKVYCRVDATQTPIQVGDLLTTSPIEGRAMKASDPARAFGAVIGKALRPLGSGLGLIPILVALR